MFPMYPAGATRLWWCDGLFFTTKENIASFTKLHQFTSYVSAERALDATAQCGPARNDQTAPGQHETDGCAFTSGVNLAVDVCQAELQRLKALFDDERTIHVQLVHKMEQSIDKCVRDDVFKNLSDQRYIGRRRVRRTRLRHWSGKTANCISKCPVCRARFTIYLE